MTGIGHIILHGDTISERALNSVLASHAEIYTTRTFYDEVDHDENGGFKPIPGWQDTFQSLPPDPLIDVIGFACTSATIALGVETLVAEFAKHRPNCKYTSPAIGVLEMMRHFGIKDIALLTPYAPALHDLVKPFFAENGIEVVAQRSLFEKYQLTSDDAIGRVPPTAIQDELSALVDSHNVDAAFVSCAAFNVVDHLKTLSDALRLPVLGSISSMAWHCLHLIGAKDAADEMASRSNLL